MLPVGKYRTLKVHMFLKSIRTSSDTKRGMSRSCVDSFKEMFRHEEYDVKKGAIQVTTSYTIPSYEVFDGAHRLAALKELASEAAFPDPDCRIDVILVTRADHERMTPADILECDVHGPFTVDELDI